MAFFKDLRRRSRASFRTTDSSKDSNNSVPSQKSSSTLSSAYTSSTPPSSHPATTSTPNLSTLKTNGSSPVPPVPTRPGTMSGSNRNSMIVREREKPSAEQFANSTRR